MICQHEGRWVLKDGDKICRLAHPREIPVVETTPAAPNSPERIKARYEDTMRKAAILKDVLGTIYGPLDQGNLTEVEEEKILLGLQSDMAEIKNSLSAVLKILSAPPPPKISLWRKICQLVGF